MGTPTICIDKNKGADQPRSNCEADQRLCFRYTDSTIPLFSKCKTSTLSPSSVMSDLFGTQIVGFLTHMLILYQGKYLHIQK